MKRFLVRIALCVLGFALCVGFGALVGLKVQRWNDKPIPLVVQKIIAIHEAAHAVVGLKTDLNFPITKVAVMTVLLDEQGLLGGMFHEQQAKPETESGRVDKAAMSLAGEAAEEVFLGIETNYLTDDQQKAKSTCRPPCPSDFDASCPLPTPDERREIERQTDDCLTNAKLLAQKLVADNGLIIMRLAELIMAQEPDWRHRMRQLDGHTVREFVLRACLKP